MGKHRTPLHNLLALFCSVLAFGLAMSLAGCGKAVPKVDEEKAVRDAIAEVMDAFKDPSQESLKELVEESDTDLSELENYGIDIYEFIGHCLKRFDYTINSVTVDGDTAKAELTVTNVDINTAVEEAGNEISSDMESYSELLQGDDGMKAFMQVYFQKVYEKIDASDKMITTDVTLNLTKKDGKWDVDEESVDALVSGMYGGIQV
ncbi:MAG: hypothetical protein Q4C09_01235 [Atopobiaceae bacterium]|nr:hypothetical protein [Atopobiaceae bacterium]